MRVVEPVTILPENIVESNLFDEPPITYRGDYTFSLGNHVSVEGVLGQIFIYKSLQNSNMNNPPLASPSWWVYVSSTNTTYSQGEGYALGVRVRQFYTNSIWESLTENNTNVLDPVATPPWLVVGTNTSTLPTAWNPATTYSIGARVLLTLISAPGVPIFGDSSSIVTYQKVWVSTVNNNLGLNPDPQAPWAPPAPWVEDKTHPIPWIKTVYYDAGRVVYTPDGKLWKTPYGVRGAEPASSYQVTWVKIGPSNRTAMFDNQSFTTSIANKAITSTVSTGVIDTVALINVSADMATVTVRNGLGGSVVYTKTAGLTGGNPTNAWDYYFSDPLLRTNQYIFDDIPPFSNSHVTLELTGGAEVSIGNLIVGKSKDLGLSVYGAQAGILDFSTKTTDFFCNTNLNQRC